MAPGEVAEWSNAPHSKCGIGASLSGVRIPPSPPIPDEKPGTCSWFNSNHHASQPMFIDSFGRNRNLLLSLFALADDSPKQIASYISLGEVLIAREGDLI